MRTDVRVAEALALHFRKVDSMPTDDQYARSELKLALKWSVTAPAIRSMATYVVHV